MIVRALAVQQPWAGLIANGRKRIEYRSWSTAYRGPILIVASRGRNREGTDEARAKGHLTETDNAKGAMLCVVDLLDVVEDDFNNYQWKLAQPRLVPITPVKGKLNLYSETVPDSWKQYFDPRPPPGSKGPSEAMSAYKAAIRSRDTQEILRTAKIAGIKLPQINDDLAKAPGRQPAARPRRKRS